MAKNDGVTDFDEYRRLILQKRIDRARRCLALADDVESGNAESVRELRKFAQTMGIESEHGKDANEFADRIEAKNPVSVALLRDSATREIQVAQAESDRLGRPYSGT